MTITIFIIVITMRVILITVTESNGKKRKQVITSNYAKIHSIFLSLTFSTNVFQLCTCFALMKKMCIYAIYALSENDDCLISIVVFTMMKEASYFNKFYGMYVDKCEYIADPEYIFEYINKRLWCNSISDIRNFPFQGIFNTSLHMFFIFSHKKI